MTAFYVPGVRRAQISGPLVDVRQYRNAIYAFEKTYVTTATLPARSCSRSLGACISDMFDCDSMFKDGVLLAAIVSIVQKLMETLQIKR